MKQHEMSRWLKALDAVSIACCIVLAIILVPHIAGEVAAKNSAIPALFPIASLYLCLVAIPPIILGGVAWRIFTWIGRDMSFCTGNAIRLRLMSIIAFVDSVLCLLGLIMLALLAIYSWETAVILLLVLTGTLALAIVSAALSHLTAKAAAIKDENDLTV